MSKEQLIQQVQHISELSDQQAILLSEQLAEESECLAAAYLPTPELCASELMLSGLIAWSTNIRAYEIGPAFLGNTDGSEKIIRGIGVWVPNSSIMTSES